MKKDALGQDVQVGDTVTFLRPRGRSLMKGIVEGFLPSGFRIEWNRGSFVETLARPTNYVVKIK